MTNIRVPAIPPVHDTKQFSDVLIELGKRIEGPTSDYFAALGDTENILKHLAAGFAEQPGDNGVSDFESWKDKGVWYKTPYLWRQIDGEFYAWDGEGYRTPMAPEEVKAKLLKTESGRFELKASQLEEHADFIHEKLGVAKDRVGLPQWLERSIPAAATSTSSPPRPRCTARAARPTSRTP
jgi:anaerobic selenocysteine-containing dehydrogenase